jgi:hypothetical protein
MKLPFGTNRLAVLFLSFITGMTVDLFVGTYGIHAAAATLTGFLRRWFLRVCFGEIEDNAENTPSVKERGFYPFLGYTTLIAGVYLVAYFLLENIGYGFSLMLIWRILASIVVSIFLIVLMEYFIQTPQKSNRKNL